MGKKHHHKKHGLGSLLKKGFEEVTSPIKNEFHVVEKGASQAVAGAEKAVAGVGKAAGQVADVVEAPLKATIDAYTNVVTGIGDTAGGIGSLFANPMYIVGAGAGAIILYAVVA